MRAATPGRLCRDREFEKSGAARQEAIALRETDEAEMDFRSRLKLCEVGTLHRTKDQTRLESGGSNTDFRFILRGLRLRRAESRPMFTPYGCIL